MIHTDRVRKALQFAARRHHGQFRKETEPLPYITHPVSVALLLADAEADEDTIIAGLLHDTIEDTATTHEELTQVFGSRVADLVLAVSEPKQAPDGTPYNWRNRKEAYLRQLQEAEDAAVLVSMADKVDNIETRLDVLARDGEEMHQRFAQPKDAYVWYHGSVLAEARRREIIGELRDRLERVIAQEKEAYGL